MDYRSAQEYLDGIQDSPVVLGACIKWMLLYERAFVKQLTSLVQTDGVMEAAIAACFYKQEKSPAY